MNRNVQVKRIKALNISAQLAVLLSICANSYAAPSAGAAGAGAGRVGAARSVAAQTQVAASEQPATTEADAAKPETATTTAATPSKDPYEGFNRAMFTFNDKIDIYFLKPVATGYQKIMPKPLYKGVHNFFNNLGEITTIANDILQFNFYQMTNDVWRFTINTTVGVGGIFDIATRMNLPYYVNDFGLTMAAWGYDTSNYLVLPFFGPNTIRDGISIPVDYFYLSIYPYIAPDKVRYGLYGLGVVDRRAHLLQYQSVMEEAALDRYVFIRDAYMQHRAQQIKDNQHLGVDDKLNIEDEDAAIDTEAHNAAKSDATKSDTAKNSA